jgi:hypothetical protein
MSRLCRYVSLPVGLRHTSGLTKVTRTEQVDDPRTPTDDRKLYRHDAFRDYAYLPCVSFPLSRLFTLELMKTGER